MRVQVNDIEIACESAGQGRPLLLIAGVGYGAWFWHKIAPGLAEHFQVITFDNRGAGGTSQPDGPYTVPLLAADAAGLLDALNVRDALVMGHSLGGFVAQELCLSRPDLVGKLILAATNHGGPSVIPITPQALGVLLNRTGDPVELVKRGIAIAAAPGLAERQPQVIQELLDYRFTHPVPPAQYQAQVAAGAGMGLLTDEQVTERMSRIRVPVLVLFGEHDQVVPPGNADLMARKLPNAQIKFVPGAGHIFPIEAPEATVQAIVEFLKG